MKTRNFTAAALLSLLLGLFGCFDDSAFDAVTDSFAKSLPIGSILIPAKHAVIYNGNGSTGGTVPVDTNEYSPNTLATVLGNTGALTRYVNPTTYSFTGWNTQSDGLGDPYTQGSVLVMGKADITLFAQWTALPTYTVTYHGNGNDGGTAPVDSTNYLATDEVTVLGNTAQLTKDNYVFAGWNTLQTGLGTTYLPGATFTMGGANADLWAIWSDQWVQDAYLKASNGNVNDYFGRSVAVSGSTLVVGADGEDSSQTTIDNRDGRASTDNTAGASGAAYVYIKTTAGNWYQDAYLKASNAEASDYFGYSVAVDGTTIAVGAYGEDSNQTSITNTDGSPTIEGSNNKALSSGAVYVFKRVYVPKTFPREWSWVQDAYLKAPNGEAYDYFGYSVAISNDTIVVGAYGEDSSQTTVTNGTSITENDGALTSGAVYVYKKNRYDNWYHDAYLKASNADASDYFGYSVSISGDTIVVGAYGEDSSQTTITNTDGSPTNASPNNGASASGAAYVFKLDTTSGDWSQDAYLKAKNAEATDYFGYSVAVDSDTIVVGAYGEDSNQTTITNSNDNASSDNTVLSSGAAYVFKKNVSGNWYQDAYLKASNAETNDYFGLSVAVSGDFIVVGAYAEDSNSTAIDNTDNGGASANNDASASGAAYIFKKNSSDNWVQDAYLKASNGEAGDNFGYSVGISGYNVVVGAVMEGSDLGINNNDGHPNAGESNNNTSGSGAAYMFTIK